MLCGCQARQPVATEVLEAAVPYVDVMSFQDFSPPAEVVQHLERFHKITGKPVLLADASIPERRNTPQRELGRKYAAMLGTLREVSSCVGWHVCGAYLTNRSRNAGFLDEKEQADPVFLEDVAKANADLSAWIRKLGLA